MPRAEGYTLHFDRFHLSYGVDLLYCGSEVVPLEPRAARVLRYLVEHNDRVVSKEELLEELWSDVFTTDGVLKKAVSQIRRVLNDDAEEARFIATYHGRGYRFIAPVKRVSQSSAAAVPVVGKAPAEAGAPFAELVPNYDQLAGRDAELTTLRGELRSALEGNPRPVVIAGEPGIGKTQLIRHFRRWTLERGAVSLYARFFDYRGARLAPFEVFIDLLRDAIAPDRGANLADAIESSCGIRLPHELFTSTDAPAAGDPFRFVVLLSRCFLALSRRHPMVLVLDDIQWADPASLDVLGYLMRSLSSEPLMVIMLVRSEDVEASDQPIKAWLEELAARRAYTTLTLERLDSRDCRDVIGSIFQIRRSGEIPRSDVETLYRLTDGNPYFLVETLRLLVSAKAIVPDAARRRWIWKGLRDLKLPATLVTAARAKIDRLPAAVRTLIEQAAVIGDEFRVATLCQLSGQDEDATEEILSEAVRSGVLTTQALSPGEDGRFQHTILRHVVYSSIPPHRQRQLHARAAEALETIYAADRDRIAEALAAHYAAAGDERRSFEASMRAWRAAVSRSDWRKAEAIVEKADEAARAMREQKELTDQEHIELLIAAGETYRSVGRIRESASALDRAVAQSQTAGCKRSLARALFVRGLTHIAQSAYSDARAALTQAVDLFLQLEDAAGVSRTTVQLASVAAAVGNYELARTLVEQTLAAEPAPDVAAQAYGILGWTLALHGQYLDAIPLLERALAYHDLHGNLRERALLLRRLHWANLSRGEYEAAIALAIRARSDFHTVGDINGEAKANMGVGQARIAQGLLAEGMSFLKRAIDQLQVIGDAHCEAECLWLLGRAQCEVGRAEEGSALLQRALKMIREIGDRDDEFRILTDCARAAILDGDVLRAKEASDAAGAIASKLGNHEGAALAALESARVERSLGHVAGSAEKARRAVAVLEDCQSSECWRGWSILGEIESAAGHGDEARSALRKAVDRLDSIRNQIDVADSSRRLEVARNRAKPARQLSDLLQANGLTAQAEHLARHWALDLVTKEEPNRQDFFRPAS